MRDEPVGVSPFLNLNEYTYKGHLKVVPLFVRRKNEVEGMTFVHRRSYQVTHGAENIKERETTTRVINFTGGSHHELSTDLKGSCSSDTTQNISFIHTICPKFVDTYYHNRH